MDTGATTQATMQEPAAAEGTPAGHPAAQPAAQPAAAPPADAGPDQDERTLAAVSYILTLLTGLIIFLVAKPEQRYARWHAVQAIGLGVAWLVVAVVFNILGMMMTLAVPLLSMFFSLLSILVGLGVLILVIVGAIKAYQGQSFRLPGLAGFADKHADQPVATQQNVPAS